MKEKQINTQILNVEPRSIVEQTWESDAIPMVSISCTTYNHGNHIRDAIKGFLIQQTTFPVEILIHDDASIDETADIIREYEVMYPQLIKPIYQTENQYSRQDGFIGRTQRARARGKYYATCEGDDYWTDPLKLQKQVDFLEKNSQYSFCCHRYKIYNENSGTFSDEPTSHLYKDSDLVIDLELFSKTWVTKTLTAVIRRNLLVEISPKIQEYKAPRDVHLFYHLLKKGNAVSLNQVMGVYRQHEGGVYSSLSKVARAKNGYAIFKEMWEHDQSDELLRRFLKSYTIQYLILSNNTPIEVYYTGLKTSHGLREKLSITKALLKGFISK